MLSESGLRRSGDTVGVVRNVSLHLFDRHQDSSRSPSRRVKILTIGSQRLREPEQSFLQLCRRRAEAEPHVLRAVKAVAGNKKNFILMGQVMTKTLYVVDVSQS